MDILKAEAQCSKALHAYACVFNANFDVSSTQQFEAHEYWHTYD